MFSLKDKVIIVTGATGVLGEAFVQAIGEAGARVVLLGRNETIAAERTARLQAAGIAAMYVIADVLDESALIAARDRILAQWCSIDGLVNAAGGNVPQAVIGPDQDVFSMDMNGLRQAFDLNLYGTILPVKIFGAAMKSGSIVNISSMAAQRAITRVLGYSMAKAAVDNFTRWMSVELSARYGGRIRMNAIAPGFFITEQNRRLLTNEDESLTARGQAVLNVTPFRRFGVPSELTGALVWLLSPASAFVQGQVISVDGGFSIFSGV